MMIVSVHSADGDGDPLCVEGAAVPGKHGLSPSAELALSPLGGVADLLLVLRLPLDPS